MEYRASCTSTDDHNHKNDNETGSYNFSEIVIEDKTNLPSGRYYILIQGFYNEPGDFVLEMICPDPTPSPTMEPTFPPSVSPTNTPTSTNSIPNFSIFISSEENELNITQITIKPIECGDYLTNQSNTETNLMSMYMFELQNTTNDPLIISTCPQEPASNQTQPHLDAHLFIARMYDTGLVLTDEDSSTHYVMGLQQR